MEQGAIDAVVGRQALVAIPFRFHLGAVHFQVPNRWEPAYSIERVRDSELGIENGPGIPKPPERMTNAPIVGA